MPVGATVQPKTAKCGVPKRSYFFDFCEPSPETKKNILTPLPRFFSGNNKIRI